MRRQPFVLLAAASLLLAVATACGGGAPSNAGKIIFGTTVDTSAMKVTDPVTSVKAGTPLGWVAYFTDAVNSTSMTLTIALVESSAESPLGSFPVSVSNPSFNEFAHQPDTSLSGQAPGTYTPRYIRPSDNKVLAEGTIQITQ